MKKWLSSTYFLAIGVPVIGGVVLITGLWLLNVIFQGNPPVDYTGVLSAVANLFFLFGFWVMIRRRELPRIGLPSTKGSLAVIVGGVCFLVCCFVEIMLIYYIIAE